MNTKNICTLMSLYLANLDNQYQESIHVNRISKITTFLTRDCTIYKVQLKLNPFIPITITNHCSIKDNRYICNGFMNHKIENELNHAIFIPELCDYDQYQFFYDKNGQIIKISLLKDHNETICIL